MLLILRFSFLQCFSQFQSVFSFKFKWKQNIHSLNFIWHLLHSRLALGAGQYSGHCLSYVHGFASANNADFQGTVAIPYFSVSFLNRWQTKGKLEKSSWLLFIALLCFLLLSLIPIEWIKGKIIIYMFVNIYIISRPCLLEILSICQWNGTECGVFLLVLL